MYIEQTEFEEKLANFIEHSYELGLILQRIGRWQDAIRLLNMGIDFAEDALQKARMQIILGEIYTRQARYDEAEDLLEVALDSAKDKLRCIELSGSGAPNSYNMLNPLKTPNPYQTVSNEPNNSNLSGVQSDCLQEKRNCQSVIGKALFALGELHYFRYAFRQESEYSVTMNYLREAQVLFEELNDYHSIMAVLTCFGIIDNYQGNEHEAYHRFQKVIALSEQFHDEQGKIIAISQLGVICERNGDFEQALQYHEQSLELSQRVGQADTIMYSLGYFAVAHYHLFDDLKLALSKCKEALEIAEKLEHKAGVCLMCKRLGILHLEAKQPQEAKQYFENLLIVAEDCGFTKYAEGAKNKLLML